MSLILSNSFLTHPDILDVTYRATSVLLERRIRLSFLILFDYGIQIR